MQNFRHLRNGACATAAVLGAAAGGKGRPLKAAILRSMVCGLILAGCSLGADSILVASKVVGAEAAFAADGNISAFWDGWIAGDSLVLSPASACVADSCNFEGAEDAALVVRVVASDSGLCMLFRVSDDCWVGTDSAGDRSGDNLIVRMDQLTPQGIADFWLLWGADNAWVGSRSFTAWSFEIPITGTNAAVRWGRYSDSLWHWAESFLTLEELKTVLKVEVNRCSLDARTRAIEMWIPWASYCRGIADSETVWGREFAFSVGYNDADSGQSERGLMRWYRSEPFSIGPDREVIGWGTLIIGTESPLSISTPEARTAPIARMPVSRQVTPGGVILQRSSPGHTDALPVQQFDLRGRWQITAARTFAYRSAD